MLYGFVLFIFVELMLNVYRISRITGWGLDIIVPILETVSLVGFLSLPFLFIYLIKSLLKGRKASFWTTVLWFPYYALFIFAFASLFPITYQGDYPNPVSGLLMIGAMAAFPFYIAVVNLISIKIFKNEEITTG
ncbi:hypothetical protein [Sutcliffiella deserti]|uniref:hypothetical protein n=1 Tax=Sutcliffiella deserti TaxID=2875501 RepID=UPI001CBFE77F|nr:hypothetical protein [Sutcliffiella deserti]